MFDCHIHMVLDGVNWRESIARHKAAPQEALIRKTLAQYQALGYTYLRDGGDRWGAGALAAKLAPEYGIRYRTPCFPIYKTGHYGSFIGRGFSTPAEYRALVRAAKAAGAHFIKIMISGLMDFAHYGVLTDEPLAPGEIADMIAGAHDEGFSVMAHANGDSAVRAALAAGVDSIEHGAYLSPETRSQLAESHAVWVPTLVTIGNLIGDGRFPDAALRPLLERYDYILIDCPPSLGLLTINALTAANSVLIPIQCEYYALEGVTSLMDTVARIKRGLNASLDIEGVLLTMLDGRTNLGLQVVAQVKKHFRGKVFATIVPRNVRLGEAPSHALPINRYDPRSTGAEAYRALAREVMARNGDKPAR